MKCLICGEYMTSNQKICSACGKINSICPKCKKPFSEEDMFCSECGNDLREIMESIKNKNITEEKTIEQKKEEMKKIKFEKELEKEMTKYASDLIIECEGNKFKAIKEFKEKYKVDNDVASKYISNAYNGIDGATNEKNSIEEIDEEELIIQEIVNRNGISNPIASIKEVRDRFGYGLAEAKEKVDKATIQCKASINSGTQSTTYKSSYKSSGKVRIKKTIIVANSSRKKATSLVGRGVVGNAIIGPLGLLAAGSAKSKDTTTFQVIYTDGKQKTVTVKTNSRDFKEYCRYLDN